MCGIVGFVDLTNYRSDYIITDNYIINSLVLDTVRGWDGTGVCFVDDNGKVSGYKRALSGPDFINSKTFKHLLRGTLDVTAFIGHNRSATSGAVDDAGAHPFTRDHITLVHNGTLAHHPGIDYPFECEVDSDGIAYALSKQPDPIKVLEKIDGAYALVWHNANDNTINFARNKERPLWMAHTKDENRLYFASEPEIMMCALNHHVTGARVFNNLHEPYALAAGKYLSLSLDALGLDKNMASKEFTPLEKKSQATQYGNMGWPETQTKPETIPTQSGSSNTGSTTSNESALDKSTRVLLNDAGLVRGTRILFHKTNYKYISGQNFGCMDGDLITNSPTHEPKILVMAPNILESVAKPKDVHDVWCWSGVIEYAWASGGTTVIKIVDVSYEGSYDEFMDGSLDWLDENFFDVEEEEDDIAVIDVDADGTVHIPIVGKEDMIEVDGGGYLHPDEYKKLTLKGCTNCEGSLEDVASTEIQWYGPDMPICPDCVDEVFGETNPINEEAISNEK